MSNANRIHHIPKLTGEDDLFFKLDAGHFRLYEAKNDPAPIYKGSLSIIMSDSEGEGANGGDTSAVEAGRASEFAYERDLRNFLAKNLRLIEPTLRLFEEEGIAGIESLVGGRFVDILAADGNNNFIVIDLKVSHGYDRVVGQLLRYMAWIEKHQADPGQKVRGIIIAEYELSVTLKKAA